MIIPLIFEFYKLKQMGSIEYFASTRNYLDISHIFFGFVNIYCQQYWGIMVFQSKCVIIFEILLSLGKTFELMKIIKEFSHIVTMIQNVIVNLNVFQLYYFVQILFFAMTFSVVAKHDYNEYRMIGPFLGNCMYCMRLSFGQIRVTVFA